jgi:serine/threonine protein kinase
MTTYASAPGTRLGGRYRLEDRIAAGSGWDAWKAIDETLARAVTVFTFAAGFPRVGDVVTAARAASRLTDPRLAQVFDVEDDWDHAYIVMEWAAGETLGDLLSQGPIEPFRAARMIAEAAAGLSSAHAAGVAHICLSPGSVRWSPTGEVKVVGLGIDAALSGATADEPVLCDTQGLGRLLYAALTGYWPGPEYPSLPPAPVAGGEPCSPRQVVAGIPPVLSDLTCRAMQLRSSDPDEHVTSPGELSRALMATLPPAPMPAAAAPPPWRDQAARTREDRWPHEARQDRDSGWSGEMADTDWSADDDRYDGQNRPARPPRQSRRRAEPRRRDPVPWLAPGGIQPRIAKVVLAGVSVLVLAAIAAFTLWPSGGTAGNHPNPGRSTPLTSASLLRPVGASGFDALTPSDRGNEDSQTAKYAIDASPSTAWNSQWYASPEFGQLKTGSGLIIDLGRTVRLSTVTVTFNSQPGAHVRLLVGNSSARSKQNLESMTTVASASSPTGTVTFHVTSTATGRYLVIWFSRLAPAPGGSGHFEAQIFNVAIKGTSAS